MKNYKKLLSIITVVKNDVYNIEKTIKSIISQKNINIEYIIIDGLSRDGTIKIVNKYKKKIDRIITEKDNGIYYAMNKSIRLIKSDWTVFLNSGDIFFDNNIIDKIHDFKKNSVDIIYGDTVINNEFFSLI